jgi:uncharacterized protein (DUF1015 family)
MAEIAPLHALRYDLGRVKDAALVLAPPYDVIGEAERAALEAGDPHNIVRLDLPRGDGEEKYAAARRLLDDWIAAGVLRQDALPSIYRYEQTFALTSGAASGVRRVRKGCIARLRLSPFTDRIVLPHERTMSGPKLDRRKLIRATAAQFSQVFVLYRDPAAQIDRAFAASEAGPPDLDTVTPDGCRHRLWVVSDAAVIAEVTALLAPRQVMIADGHHRYETMVDLRDECRPPAAAPGTSGWDWATVFLARAEDPGLLVLPTHRLLKDLPASSLDDLHARAATWFDIAEGDEHDASAIDARLAAAPAGRVTFAFRTADRATTTWWQLRADADLSALGPPQLRGLDVTVLHGLVLDPLFGIDREALAAGTRLFYRHDTEAALGDIAAGRARAGFFLNATRVEQVLDACEAGFVLPQKSTYFHPKPATGLVMARLDAAQAVSRVD